jgi:transcriptional regulator with XRE-family HTH domain
MLYKSMSRTVQWIIPARGGIPEFMKAEFPGVTPETVGARLRLTRKALDLSQTEFGRRAGISKSAMNNIERGRNFPTIPNVVALAEAHDLTLLWVCAGSMQGLRHELVEAIRALEKSRAASPSKAA